jgi:ubiquinone/menaquinone biosynthesis C-methylase UbiE
LLPVRGQVSGYSILVATQHIRPEVAPAVGHSEVVIGIDPSPSSVDYAAAQAPRNCTFRRAQGQYLRFADASLAWSF